MRNNKNERVPGDYVSPWEATYPVYCYETSMVYDHIADAAYDLNVDEADIFECCAFRKQAANGYHFCFEQYSDELISMLETLEGGKYKRTPVKAIYAHTQEWVHFQSFRQACDAFAMPDSAIRHALDHHSDIRGWLFEYYDEDEFQL